MGFLCDDDLATLLPSELVGEPTPIPTQIVSSDEYFPAAQNAKQREVEARLLDMGERLAKRHGISRRRFFQTASGMAAAFVAIVISISKTITKVRSHFFRWKFSMNFATRCKFGTARPVLCGAT